MLHIRHQSERVKSDGANDVACAAFTAATTEYILIKDLKRRHFAIMCVSQAARRLREYNFFFLAALPPDSN